ncbi:MAG: LysR family transcriptional regulator [Proteobacteria bacterium]|nr:LysR family transcriptional regulator [Pseudomonadota bacterium]MCH8212466.1 LysR family transcriptional regulator [Pseudomonadota bacterium]
MFLRQFEYLVAVAEEQHFGRAAERCHVSQPSLSNGIKQLELELGVPIVRRGQRFHGLTAEGWRVAEWARRVIAHRDAMRDELALMHDNLQGNLRMGAMPTCSPVVPMFTQLLRHRHPGVRADIQFIGIEAMKVGLGNFSLDVGITYLNEKDLYKLNSLPIYVERQSLLVPDTEEFRNRTEITWAEAAELPLALLRKSMHERQIVDKAFESVGCEPKPHVECDTSILHLMFHVMSGALMTIIPGHFALVPGTFPGTRALDLVDPVISSQVGLIWAEGDPTMPMAKVMVSVVQELQKSGELQRKLGDFAVVDKVAAPVDA